MSWCANLFFWAQAGYWDLEAGLKPLLHTWSLAVEEHSYLAWPALLLGAIATGDAGRCRSVFWPSARS